VCATCIASTNIEIKETSCKYVLWFKCKGGLFKLDQPVIFGIVYIPPEYTKYSSDEAFNMNLKLGKLITFKSSVFVSTKHKISWFLIMFWNSGYCNLVQIYPD
jgi:hypothetical protein